MRDGCMNSKAAYGMLVPLGEQYVLSRWHGKTSMYRSCEPKMETGSYLTSLLLSEALWCERLAI